MSRCRSRGFAGSFRTRTLTHYFMGWGVPEGKLLTYEAYAAKQAIRDYTLTDADAGLALTVYGDGETTTARYGQFRDKSYVLYILDTLDYHLR